MSSLIKIAMLQGCFYCKHYSEMCNHKNLCNSDFFTGLLHT